MKRVLVLLIFVLFGCKRISHISEDGQLKNQYLPFENCSDEIAFKAINIRVPDGYKLNKLVRDHGHCEYQFQYEKEGTLYVSSDIYSGSPLNYENRLNAGIQTYSDKRNLDERIKVCGVQADGRFWMERIEGKYTVGYLNAQDTTFFSQAIKDIWLISISQEREGDRCREPHLRSKDFRN